MSWKNTRFIDDTDVDSSATVRRLSHPKFERRSSYSLERFLQEADEQELSPASSVEARYIDTAEFARRRKRMQSPTSSTGPYGGGIPPPGSNRKPRLLLMGQRRYGFTGAFSPGSADADFLHTGAESLRSAL